MKSLSGRDFALLRHLAKLAEISDADL
jgi:hypothetical protein